MRIEDVPAEPSALFDHQRKVVYAADASGALRPVATGGGEVEELVTLGAVDHFARLAQAMRGEVAQGRASTLAFHMFARRMDPPTLAQTIGMMQWRVRRHLRIPFPQLAPRLQHRYAQALGLGVDEIARLPPEATA
jgi:hypothetical protein